MREREHHEIELTISTPQETEFGVTRYRQSVDAWRELIESAEKTLFLAQMYIATDHKSSSEELVERLVKRSREGIKITIFIDEYIFQKNLCNGDTHYTIPVNRLTKEENISVIYHPMRKFNGGILHAKIVIADDRIAWIGSNNFDWRSFDHILELGVIIYGGTFCVELRDAISFGITLVPEYNSGESGGVNTNYVDRVNYDGIAHGVEITGSPLGWIPSRMGLAPEKLTKLIMSAKKQLLIQTRRISTVSRLGDRADWRGLVEEIVSAANRGVDVRMLVDKYQLNRVNDTVLLESMANHPNIFVRIVEIPEMSTGPIPHARMLHSKAVVADGAVSWIGTGNLIPDDFLVSKNFGVFVDGERLATDLAGVFNVVWSSRYVRAF